MPLDHRKRAFEESIEHYLMATAGHAERDPEHFDCE